VGDDVLQNLLETIGTVLHIDPREVVARLGDQLAHGWVGKAHADTNRYLTLDEALPHLFDIIDAHAGIPFCGL
jgi:hypothetical protein